MWRPSAQLKPGGCSCAALLSCSPGALIMMTLGECTRLEKEILQVSTRLADTNGQESRLRLQLEDLQRKSKMALRKVCSEFAATMC
jgi:formiminotetrahydrofolate cyclodeaminase